MNKKLNTDVELLKKKMALVEQILDKQEERDQKMLALLNKHHLILSESQDGYKLDMVDATG